MFDKIEDARELIKDEKDYFMQFFEKSDQIEVEEKLNEIVLTVLSYGYNVGRKEEREGVPKNDL